MTRQPWNWGIPVNIPAPDFYDDEPCELASLKFSPVGLYDLRRRIGVLTAEPGVYNQHQAQFDASDLAWFAALLSSSQALLAAGPAPYALQVHALFRDLRQLTPLTQSQLELRGRVQDLTFDLVRILQCTLDDELTMLSYI